MNKQPAGWIGKRLGSRRSLLAVLLACMELFMASSSAVAGNGSTAPYDSIFASPEMTPVMSFNLFVGNSEGERSWNARRPQVSRIINEYRPLFLGTQEGLNRQIEDLKSDLPGYKSIGVSRRGDTTDEYSAIFYDSSRAKEVKSGNFWLSETPDKAGSVMSGSGHPRMVSWGEFKVEGQSANTFFFNTHMALEESIAVKQADVFLKQLEKIVPEGAEVVITGDFNSARNSEVWNRFAKAGFADALQMADHKGGPNHTSHCWKGEEVDTFRRQLAREGHKVDMVDWIFHRGGGDEKNRQPLLANVITDHDGSVYPSDHYALVLTSLGKAKAEAVSAPLDNPLRVSPDQPIRLAAAVENSGERGIVPLQLKEDGKTTSVKWQPLDKGQSKTIAFDTKLYASGKHTLAINDLTPVPVLVDDKPARLGYTELSIDPYPKPGEETAIHAGIRNTGGKSDVEIVEMRINGDIATSEGISLKPGESKDIAFTFTFPEEGAYTVSVGDREQEINVMRDLDKGWVFAKGDDAARAKPEFDDKKWQPVNLPMPWEEHSNYTEDNVYGWYRNAVVIPKEWEGRPVRLLLGQIDDADQTFFNGQQIGSGGHMPEDKEGYESAAFKMRSYTVPPELIKYGEPNILSVRVFDELGNGGMAKGPLGMLPLKGKAASKWQDTVKDQRAAERTANQR